MLGIYAVTVATATLTNSTRHSGYQLSSYKKWGGRTRFFHHPPPSSKTFRKGSLGDTSTAVKITIEPCTIPSLIVGVVEILRAKEKWCYGLCLELHGSITFGDKSIPLFSGRSMYPSCPEPEHCSGDENSHTSCPSSVFCLVAGEPEGTLLGNPTSSPQPNVLLKPGLNHFSFILNLEGEEIPASLANDQFKIEYELELYIRTKKLKYKLLGNKKIRLDGHLILPKEEEELVTPLIKTIIPSTLTSGFIKYIQTKKFAYLKGEGIPFLIQLHNLAVSATVTVNLVNQLLLGNKVIEENTLETIRMRIRKFDASLIKGELNKCGRKVKMPSYHWKAKDESVAVTIVYFIQCKVTCGTMTTLDKMEITIGTAISESKEGLTGDGEPVIQWNENLHQWEPFLVPKPLITSD